MDNLRDDQLINFSNMNENIDKDNADDNDIIEVIIQLLADHGYQGVDALKQLAAVYQVVQDRSLKNWQLKNIDKFLTLKDSVWYNFEYLVQTNQLLGKTDLKTLGSRFPIFTEIFINSSICSYILLPQLLKEVNSIISLWLKTKNVYLVNFISEIYDGTNSKVILYKRGESPSKYSSDAVKRTVDIIGTSGENLQIAASKYVYVEVLGLLNDYEQSNIYYAILEDLKNVINKAMQYHQDLRLVVE